MGSIHERKTSWAQRPRNERKLAYIRMKNKIAAHAPHLGGRFTTHDVIAGNSWADIYFLSRQHRNRIYNSTVDAALYAYFEKCDGLAWEASEALLPSDLEDFSEMFAKNADGSSTLLPPSSRRVEAEKRAFGGLRRYEWIDREKLRIADSGDVWIQPGIELDFSYRFGVGLHATLACEKLDVAMLDDFIKAFLDGGEKPFIDSSVKLSFPSSRARDASSVNALSDDPSAWAQPLALRNQALSDHASISELIGSPEARTGPKAL